MKKFEDLTNKKFGRWLVIGRGPNKIYGKYSYIAWECLCECGNRGVITTSNLKGKKPSRSCGCYMREKAISDGTTHGLSGTKEYSKWLDMHQRCYNENYSRYKDWGGRGIKICDQWHKSNPNGFINYYNAVKNLGPKPYPSATIDRINNNKDYSPDNIKWSDKRQQRLNQQSHRVRYLTYDGETLCMKDWSKRLLTHSSNILYHLKRDKSFDWIYNHYRERINVTGI